MTKDIYCYDENLNIIGVVDNFYSFTFTRSYSDIGDWSITISGYSANAELLRKAVFITAGKGIAGIKTNVTITRTEDAYDVVVSGKELKALVEKRIVMPPTNEAYLTYNNISPEQIIVNLLQTQLTNPTDTKRKIAGAVVTDGYEGYEKLEYSGRFSSLSEDIKALTTAYDIGWYADIENKQIKWHIFHGVDRRASQTVNSRLIFGYEYDTISGSTFQQIYHQSNTALVGGQGEELERELVMINDTNSGLARTEVFIDARDIEEGDNLSERGAEKLKELYSDIVYEVLPCEGYFKDTYRNTYDLGDIGSLKDEGVDFRLTSIVEIYENNQFKLQFTFGYDTSSLSKALERMMSNTKVVTNIER